MLSKTKIILLMVTVFVAGCVSLHEISEPLNIPEATLVGQKSGAKILKPYGWLSLTRTETLNALQGQWDVRNMDKETQQRHEESIARNRTFALIRSNMSYDFAPSVYVNIYVDTGLTPQQYLDQVMASFQKNYLDIKVFESGKQVIDSNEAAYRIVNYGRTTYVPAYFGVWIVTHNNANYTISAGFRGNTLDELPTIRQIVASLDIDESATYRLRQ
ncbi:MAG: hypothetical protein CL799_08745 [Chromatiales bacterium]|nr:hypothetical protein [Chromatiales bacterium]